MDNIDEIKKTRNELGKILHSYYVNYGEEKYDKFVSLIAHNMKGEYGDIFSEENLRIMEAEYVTFNQKINDETKPED